MSTTILRLNGTGYQVIQLFHTPNLTIIHGRKRFLVHATYIKTISPFFVNLLTGGFLESGASEIELKDDHDSLAVEIILRASHGEPGDSLLKLPGANNLAFLKRLAEASQYFDCGYLVPEEFNVLLRLPGDDIQVNQHTNFMPALVIAYSLGWEWEAKRLFRIVVRYLRVTGSEKDYWIYHQEVYLRDLPAYTKTLRCKYRSYLKSNKIY